MQPSRPLRVEPLIAARFAPFGDVLENDGSARRNYYPAATAAGQGEGELRYWISYVEPAQVARLMVAQIERHPYAAQTFIPVQASRWLVIVAPHQPDGSPDVSAMRAFLAAPGQGISYRRGTWHHGTTVLDAPAQFAVLMWRRTAGDDDEFYDLDTPIEVNTNG